MIVQKVFPIRRGSFKIMLCPASNMANARSIVSALPTKFFGFNSEPGFGSIGCSSSATPTPSKKIYTAVPGLFIPEMTCIFQEAEVEPAPSEDRRRAATTDGTLAWAIAEKRKA
jgi:hypothetical protein